MTYADVKPGTVMRYGNRVIVVLENTGSRVTLDTGMGIIDVNYLTEQLGDPILSVQDTEEPSDETPSPTSDRPLLDAVYDGRVDNQATCGLV